VNRVPWWANDTPGTLDNHWTSTKGAKGSVVVVLVDLAFVSPSNELTLQASKVCSESMDRMND
jgi:hypothetical protein